MSATAPEAAPAPQPPAVASLPAADKPEQALSPRLQRLLLWVVAALPTVVALVQLGRIHPDEVYQFLEPAWYRVHGYGLMAWEWRDGMRNWAYPIVASWLLRLALVLGIEHPVGYRSLLALPQLALHAWGLWAVYRYVERRAGSHAGLLGMVLVGVCGPVMVFAGRTLGESLSAPLLCVAMEALDRDERPARMGTLAGLTLGFSVVVRYGSSVFVLAALLWLVARRQWRLLLFTCLSGGVVAAGLAALDTVTWGAPFHSLLTYSRFNVFSDGAARNFGAMPWDAYLRPLLSVLPVWVWLGVPALVAPGRKLGSLSLPLFCAVPYVLALSATAHKEDRFLYPAIVLLAMAAAAPATRFLFHAGRLRLGVVALVLLLSLVPWRYYPSEETRGDMFRGIISLTRRPGTTGLLVTNEGPWGVGGFFYLGRNLPWLTAIWPNEPNFLHAMGNRTYNRALAYDGRGVPELEAAGFRQVGRIGRAKLFVRD